MQSFREPSRFCFCFLTFGTRFLVVYVPLLILLNHPYRAPPPNLGLSFFTTHVSTLNLVGCNV